MSDQKDFTDPLLEVEEENISEQERRDIYSSIDRMVSQNRQPVKPEAFSLSGSKSGLLFPILINLIIALVVVAGILFLNRFFSVRRENLSQEVDLYSSAEGQLLAALRRETQLLLQQKSVQIEMIQQQLTSLEAEEDVLERNIEVTLQQREAEQRRALELALQRERDRLTGLGISEAEVQIQMSRLQDELERRDAEELRRIREDMLVSNELREADLFLEKKAMVSTLQAVIRQRAQLLQDLEMKETALRTQHAQEQSLAVRTNQAELALEEIASQRAAEKLFTDQINGYYTTIMEHIRLSAYDRALAELGELEDFLTGSAAQPPGILERRTIELFIAEALQELMVDRMVGAGSAQEFLAFRQFVARGDAEFAQEAFEQARVSYGEALKALPLVLSLFSRLDEIEMQERVDDALVYIKQAETEAGRGGFEPSQNAYRDALLRLSEGSMATGARAVDGLLRILDQEAKARLQELQRSLDSTNTMLDRERSRWEQTLSALESELTTSEDELSLVQRRYKKTLTELQSELEQLRVVAAKAENLAEYEQRAQALGREIALQDILMFLNTAVDRESKTYARVVRKSEEDPLYGAVVREIDILLSTSTAAGNGTLHKLLGTVSMVSSDEIVVEALVNLSPAVGAQVQIKRIKELKQEIIIARGRIHDVSGGKIVVRIDRFDQKPQVMDMVYLRVAAE